MHTIDIILMLPLAIAAVRGFSKGLILEIFSFIGIIIGFIAAFRLTCYTLDFLQSISGDHKWVVMLAYILTFLAAFIAVILIGKLFEKAVDFAALGPINRLLGAIFSVLKTAFFIGIIFWLSAKINLVPASVRENSISYPILTSYADKVIRGFATIWPGLKHGIENLEKSEEKDKSYAILLPGYRLITLRASGNHGYFSSCLSFNEINV